MQSNRNDYDIIFYDGECGMCHGLVRFILPRDKSAIFRFAPLQGETLGNMIGPAERAVLPDSVAVRTPSGEVLTRFAATIYVVRRLGGFYRLMAALLSLLPNPFRDRLYDFIARRRKRWFRTPQTLCPMIPEQLRERFLP